jgi:cell shape-determining protein MreC
MDPEPKVLINHARALERALNNADARIKQLEEELMEVKNKHSVLVADVALDEDRAERIKQLEEENDALRADLLLWEQKEVKS